MRRRRKTKIVATLGPSSSSPEQLKALFEAGVDVFRINMSHTSHELLATLHGRVRALEREEGRPIGILADLQGPKIRVGTLPGGMIKLTEGERIKLVRAASSNDPSIIPIPHGEVFAALKQQPLPFDRRRQDPPAHLVVEARFRGSGRRSGRRIEGPQGHQSARYAFARFRR